MKIRALIGSIAVAGLLAGGAFWVGSGRPRPASNPAPAPAITSDNATGRSALAPYAYIHVNPLRDGTTDAPEVFSVTPIAGGVTGSRFQVIPPNLEGHRQGTEMVLAMKGQGRFPAGSPNLPTVTALLPGIADQMAVAEISHSSFTEIEGGEVSPVPTSHIEYGPDDTAASGTTLVPNQAIYGTDAFWPQDLVSVTEAWMGTQKVTRIEVRPVQYNPVTGTVRYHHLLEGAIRYASKAQVEDSPPRAAPGPVVETAASSPLDCPEPNSGPVLPHMNGDPEDFAVRRSGQEVDAIYKILTRGEGLFKITQPELVAAGMPVADLVGDQIRLFNRDREVAIYTSTSGPMGASDHVVFYGPAFTGLYSLTNVFWLGTGGTGLRMQLRSSPPSESARDIASHHQRQVFAPNTFFTDSVAPTNEEWDHWRAAPLLSFPGVGDILTASGTFLTDYPLSAGEAKLCVTLHGVAESPTFPGFRHNTEIKINNQLVHTVQWNGTGNFGGSPITDEVVFPASLLSGSATDFFLHQVLLPGNTAADQVYLESISLAYPRQLRTVDNRLHFTGSAGDHNYQVDGLTATSGLWVLDLTDSLQPVRVTDYATPFVSGSYQLRFHHDAAMNATYAVSPESAFGSVASVVKTAIRGLGDPVENQADYIVICPDVFQDEAYRLVANRHLQGEAVIVASPEDIYNEFSYGIKTTEGIKQFLGYAFHHWAAPAPQRVLLIGDATYDPNGYLNPTDMDLVPAHMGGTPFTYTSLDVWFTRVNGSSGGEDDVLADMAIGRIPVRSPAALAEVVDKIIAYEALPASDPFRKRGLVITGDETASYLGFNVAGDDIAAIMTSNAFTSVQKEYSPGVDGNRVIGAINTSPGRFAMAYLGHGAHEFWNNPIILHTSDLAEFTNDRLPIVTATTCINGYFIHPDAAKEGFAESIVELPGHGAIAAIAGTALSQDAAASEIGCKFYQTLLTQEAHTLGEAMMGGYLGAFQTFGTSPELYFYQIFGDPGLVVNP